MSFLDKVKSAAQDVGAAAKKGTVQLQGKIEQSQLRKKADDAAKSLGYLIVRERTEGTPAGEDAERLVNEIVGLETQIQADAQATAQAMAEADQRPATEAPAPPPQSATRAPPPASASQPVEGDFKLD